MSKRSVFVKDLAREAGLELDEALVSLWDNGIEDPESGHSVIPARDVPKARTAVGLPRIGRDEATVRHWMSLTGLGHDDFVEWAEGYGVAIGRGARRLPKHGTARLRRAFRESNAVEVPAGLASADGVRPDSEGSGGVLPHFEWRELGSSPPTRYLTVDDVRQIHKLLEEEFSASPDPISPPGVRDENLLSSAVFRPSTALGQNFKYPTVEMAGAALFHSLTLNHSFHNGNKRTALVSLLSFLDCNGYVLTASERELFRYTLRVAQRSLVRLSADMRSDRECLAIAQWIRANSRQLDKREHPMKWIRLKQRLREFDCHMDTATVGNRLNIWRQVDTGQRMGLSRRRVKHTLRTQVACAGDGTEADKNLVHKIRRELHLDEDHGIDSATFYRGQLIDAFILEYGRILRQLAKL